MRALLVVVGLNTFDPGRDLLVSELSFVTWRKAGLDGQEMVKGRLFCLVPRRDHSGFVLEQVDSQVHEDNLVEIRTWLDREWGPDGYFGVYKHTRYRALLRPLRDAQDYKPRIRLINEFMLERFGIRDWIPTGIHTPVDWASQFNNIRGRFVEYLMAHNYATQTGKEK